MNNVIQMMEYTAVYEGVNKEKVRKFMELRNKHQYMFQKLAGMEIELQSLRDGLSNAQFATETFNKLDNKYQKLWAKYEVAAEKYYAIGDKLMELQETLMN